MKNKFFSRNMTWSAMDNSIVVHDSKTELAPRMITMEPWHETIFLAADGEHTVQQLIDHMGSQYEGGIPEGLDQQILEIINILEKEQIVRVHEGSQELPSFLAEDYNQASPEERKLQMIEHGFITEN